MTFNLVTFRLSACYKVCMPFTVTQNAEFSVDLYLFPVPPNHDLAQLLNSK